MLNVMKTMQIRKRIVYFLWRQRHGFDETIYWYDNLMKHMKWNSLEKVLCGGIFDISDIDNTAEGKEKIEEAYKLGLAI